MWVVYRDRKYVGIFSGTKQEAIAKGKAKCADAQGCYEALKYEG